MCWINTELSQALAIDGAHAESRSLQSSELSYTKTTSRPWIRQSFFRQCLKNTISPNLFTAKVFYCTVFVSALLLLYVEQLWLTARTVSENVDDQMRMNKALDSMGVQWKQLNDDDYYQGITSGNTPLRITALPRSVVCRTCGKKVATPELYIWHQQGGHKDGASKKESLGRHHVWFLKDDWNASIWHIAVSPKQWLLSITEVPTNASFSQQG